MSIYAPKLSEKEAQNIVSEVFRDTGYRLERRDPVFVQYIVQKMLLQDFAERQAVGFDGFVERTLPTIKNEAKILAEIGFAARQPAAWASGGNADLHLCQRG